jgi:hypothetical protein
MNTVGVTASVALPYDIRELVAQLGSTEPIVAHFYQSGALQQLRNLVDGTPWWRLTSPSLEIRNYRGRKFIILNSFIRELTTQGV